jgi:pimeloyl-ACP methyl ester carboxylesterase
MITGQWDHIAPPHMLSPIVREMPDATLEVAPCRHLPMDSTPEQFERWLMRHLPPTD